PWNTEASQPQLPRFRPDGQPPERPKLADLLLVDGNPLENINLIADPAKNFKVIMKDGRVYKNTL
ncbi:hypothetical protein, partial [Bradyrhizobium liaoningense]|uniref:hypothetical protein n=1 Tax=Bradyrhizobium liaoningense TaxID=43992 RepID=UPI00390895CD